MNKVVFREKTHGEFKTSDGDDFLLRNLELGSDNGGTESKT